MQRSTLILQNNH